MGGGLEGRAPRVSAEPARGTYVSPSEGYRLVSAGTPSLLGGIYHKCRRRNLRFYARIGLFCALQAKNDRFYIRPPSCPPSSKIQCLIFSKRGSAKDQKTRKLSLQSWSSVFRLLGVEILLASYSVVAKKLVGRLFWGAIAISCPSRPCLGHLTSSFWGCNRFGPRDFLRARRNSLPYLPI